jgi:hypothetical protein
MGNMPMSTCGRLILVGLCLMWMCAIHVFAQASSPPSSQSGLDNAGKPEVGDKPADGEAGSSSTSTASSARRSVDFASEVDGRLV